RRAPQGRLAYPEPPRQAPRRAGNNRPSSAPPRAQNPPSHFAAVRSLQPAASAAAATVHPSCNTRRQIKPRLLGQVRWLACNFIRCPPLELVASTPPASREARMNNVLRNYT